MFLLATTTKKGIALPPPFKQDFSFHSGMLIPLNKDDFVRWIPVTHGTTAKEI